MLGEPLFKPDISRVELAAAAGTTIEAVRAAVKSDAILLMQKGIDIVVRRLHEDKAISGIISLGGGQGTVLATAVMQNLPFGFPKVMVSTVANGQQTFGPFMGHKDIAIIHSVADILGLNRITRTVLAKGVGALLGMAEIEGEVVDARRPTVAITSAGVTTSCVMKIREILEERGYEVIAFHCNGVGPKAMEELAAQGEINGIIDLTPHDIADRLFGGIFPSDEDRLQAPAAHGIPTVFVPGGLDFILFGAVSETPIEMLERKHVRHNPLHTHVRANREEMRLMGEYISARLIENKGPVEILIPSQGFTQLNRQSLPMYDPESDVGFLEGVESFLQHVDHQIRIQQHPLHINDDQFALAVSDAMDAMLKESTNHE